MTTYVLGELFLPVIGTTLGAACVFFVKGAMPRGVGRALTGFAAGVMVAASVWSLLIPAMEQSAPMGKWAFVPAVVGMFLGFLFLMMLDRLIPHLHAGSDTPEGPASNLKRSSMLVLAVAKTPSSTILPKVGSSSTPMVLLWRRNTFS
jgi:ZIP family zinc transporter